jgi:hypothetical protein
MSIHKFKIGQNLRLTARLMGGSERSQFCKVVRLLPQEDGQPQYRVKCVDENVERVVKEFALSRRD